jgi:hypothetical protein
MLSEEKVVDYIIELESKNDPEDPCLDEGEQAKLQAYYTVLNRELDSDERERLKIARKEVLGE